MSKETNAVKSPVDRVFDDANCYTENLPASMVPEGTDIIFLADSSFFPFYEEGQRIFVHRCGTLRNGEFGAVILNGKPYMKFYSEEATEDSHRVLLRSVNPDIPPVYVGSDDEFGIIGKVIA